MSVQPAGVPASEPEQHLGRRAASNTIYVFIGSVLSRLMGLVLVGYLAREFDVSGLGSYNLVVAYTGLFSLVADFGLVQYLTRELAARPEDHEILLRRAAIGSFAAGALAFCLCNGIAAVVGYDDELLRWILIASLPMFFGPAFAAIAILNAGLRGGRVAALSITNQTLGAGVVLFVVLTGGTIQTLVIVQAVQSLVYAALIAWGAGVWRVYRRGWRPLPLAAGLRMVWASVPLGAMAIIALVYYRLDTLMLSVITDEESVGYYTGAWRLTEALHIVPAAVTATMLPLAAWRGGLDAQRLANAMRIAFRFLALIGVPVVVGCMILATPIIKAVYGPALVPASDAFRVLIAAEIVFFFGAVAAATLVGLRMLKKAFIAQLVSVPLNAAACAIFLPHYGYEGAAWISLVTEIVVVAYLLHAVKGFLAHEPPIVPAVPAALALLSSMPMAAVILFMQAASLPVIPTILAGAIVFGLALVAVGGLRREDLRLLTAARPKTTA